MNDSLIELQEYISSEEDQPLPLQKKSFSGFSYEANFKKIIYNIKYNLVHSDFVPISSCQRRAIQITQDSQPAFLLGTTFYFPSLQAFVNKFRSIIWLSYRNNNKSGKTDAGWGCMIRVIQMVLAEVLKRNNPKSPLIEIIQLFKQGNEHLFSIDNICQNGQIHQRCTGSNEILSIICSMLTNQLQNQACRSIGPTIKPTLNCRILPEIYYSTLQIKNIESESSFSIPRFIIISNRIQNNSDGTIPIYYIDHMKHLMKLKYFCGLVGGISNQALYIVGYHQEKAIILDPHYIQDEGEEEIELKYFQQTPRGIPFNKLKNSFSFCFLIENVHEYHEWASQLCYCHQIYSPYLAFEVQSDDPNYIIQKYRKKSEDYEYL